MYKISIIGRVLRQLSEKVFYNFQ